MPERWSSIISTENLTQNSFQAELSFEPARKFDVRLAYRFWCQDCLQPPVARAPSLQRTARLPILRMWLTVLSLTIQLPTAANVFRIRGCQSRQYQLQQRSPAYVLMNAQVSKTIGKSIDGFLYRCWECNQLLPKMRYSQPLNHSALLWCVVGLGSRHRQNVLCRLAV